MLPLISPVIFVSREDYGFYCPKGGLWILSFLGRIISFIIPREDYGFIMRREDYGFYHLGMKVIIQIHYSPVDRGTMDLE